MGSDHADEGRPFLQRWSQRKRDREPDGSEVEAAANRPPTEASADPEPESEEQRLQFQRNREEAEAIDLDSLNARSDLSPFFRAGVPKALKKAAMRAVWRSDPVFANLDGLNDYEENFADPELIRKFAGTAWKIGRGYLSGDAEAEGAFAAAGEAHEASEDAAEAGGQAGSAAEDDRTDAPAREDEGGGEAAAEARDDEPVQRIPLRNRLALDDWPAD